MAKYARIRVQCTIGVALNCKQDSKRERNTEHRPSLLNVHPTTNIVLRLICVRVCYCMYRTVAARHHKRQHKWVSHRRELPVGLSFV